MKNLYKALAAFQVECPVIFKDTTGYGYTYADLPAIFKVIMPLLDKHGLGFTQILRDNGVETTVFHIETGESVTGHIVVPTDVELKGMNPYQVMGSAFTYYRRYALSSMLGIITDKDTDAQGEQVKRAEPKTEPRTKRVITDDESLFQRSMAKVATMTADELKAASGKLVLSTPKGFTEPQVVELVDAMQARLRELENSPF
jgi:hypothetical protein